MVNTTPRPLYPVERDPLPTVQKAGWALGPVWTGSEILAPTPVFDQRTVQPIAVAIPTTLTRPTYTGLLTFCAWYSDSLISGIQPSVQNTICEFLNIRNLKVTTSLLPVVGTIERIAFFIYFHIDCP